MRALACYTWMGRAVYNMLLLLPCGRIHYLSGLADRVTIAARVCTHALIYLMQGSTARRSSRLTRGEGPTAWL